MGRDAGEGIVSAMDRRRRRFVAWDVLFFDGTFGVMLRERFGPTGITLFLAFICACKRSIVPGQIEYGSEADFLAQVGLPDLRMVNEAGEEWTLDEFWRALGDHKQTSRTRRGRLVNVRSTRWERWQVDITSEITAERKRRSRATNTGTKHGQSTDGTGTKEARKRPETERETDPPSSPPVDTNGAASIGKSEEDRSRAEPTPPPEPPGPAEHPKLRPLAAHLAEHLWPGRPRMLAESVVVVGKCLAVADPLVVDECIGAMIAAGDPPRSPRYLLTTVRNRLVGSGAFDAGDDALAALGGRT